jgi:tetratricopeptide (TPR) repeat protein
MPRFPKKPRPGPGFPALIGFVLLIELFRAATASAGGAELLAEAARASEPARRIELADAALASGDLDRIDQASALNLRGWGRTERLELDAAVADLTLALELDPDLAWAYVNRAYAWNEKGRFDQAIADCDRAIAINPALVMAYVNRGFAWNQKEDFDRALADSQRAIDLDPQSALAFINRGHAWHEKGNRRQARDDCEEAARLAPDHGVVLNSLAYLLATCPDRELRDGPRAMRLAERAAELRPELPMVWDTLAAAYLEAGRLELAKITQEKAIALLDARGAPREMARRALYLEQLHQIEARLKAVRQ